MRRSKFVRALAMFCVLIAGSGGVVASTASSAAAVTCYGHYCSGKDPNATGCANDARTLGGVVRLEQAVIVPPGVVLYWDVKGTLELRYSPTCKTKWARMKLTDDVAYVSGIRVKKVTGYEQYKYTAGPNPISTKRGQFHTNMIYSPGIDCIAVVDVHWMYKSDSTAWN